mgnify:CR=1 FL=1
MGLINQTDEQYYLGPDSVWNSWDEDYGNYQFTSIKDIINERSVNSDLTIIGFRGELVKKQKLDIFEGYDKIGNILFVNSINKKDIE